MKDSTIFFSFFFGIDNFLSDNWFDINLRYIGILISSSDFLEIFLVDKFSWNPSIDSEFLTRFSFCRVEISSLRNMIWCQSADRDSMICSISITFTINLVGEDVLDFLGKKRWENPWSFPFKWRSGSIRICHSNYLVVYFRKKMKKESGGLNLIWII